MPEDEVELSEEAMSDSDEDIGLASDADEVYNDEAPAFPDQPAADADLSGFADEAGDEASYGFENAYDTGSFQADEASRDDLLGDSNMQDSGEYTLPEDALIEGPTLAEEAEGVDPDDLPPASEVTGGDDTGFASEISDGLEGGYDDAITGEYDDGYAADGGYAAEGEYADDGYAGADDYAAADGGYVGEAADDGYAADPAEAGAYDQAEAGAYDQGDYADAGGYANDDYAPAEDYAGEAPDYGEAGTEYADEGSDYADAGGYANDDYEAEGEYAEAEGDPEDDDASSNQPNRPGRSPRAPWTTSSPGPRSSRTTERAQPDVTQSLVTSWSSPRRLTFDGDCG